MYRNPSQLATEFLRSLKFLQKHFDEPCDDSLKTLESKGLTDFRTRSTSFIILKTLSLLIKQDGKFIWNKAKYPEVTARLSNQVLDLAIEKNQADKKKSKMNVKEKAREAKIFSRPIPGTLLTSKRSLVLISRTLL